MKIFRINTRFILSATLFSLLFPSISYPQGTDIAAGRKKGLFFGLTIGPSQTSIINNGILTVAELKSNKKNSFCAAIDLGYLFSDYFGFTTGIGYSSYITEQALDTYATSFDTTDMENETYERLISGNDIKEIQKVSFLYIPLQMNLVIPVGKTFGFFVQAGVNLSFPLSKTYSSTGTFTYSGYYPAYNVTLDRYPI